MTHRFPIRAGEFCRTGRWKGTILPSCGRVGTPVFDLNSAQIQNLGSVTEAEGKRRWGGFDSHVLIFFFFYVGLLFTHCGWIVMRFVEGGTTRRVSGWTFCTPGVWSLYKYSMKELENMLRWWKENISPRVVVINGHHGCESRLFMNQEYFVWTFLVDISNIIRPKLLGLADGKVQSFPPTTELSLHCILIYSVHSGRSVSKLRGKGIGAGSIPASHF